MNLNCCDLNTRNELEYEFKVNTPFRLSNPYLVLLSSVLKGIILISWVQKICHFSHHCCGYSNTGEPCLLFISFQCRFADRIKMNCSNDDCHF